MSVALRDKAAERVWKHRFAQTLFDYFCEKGLDRAEALDDAYAHADAQYLVRGLGSPEDEARSALTWITAHKRDAVVTQYRARPDANANDDTYKRTSAHDGAQQMDGASDAD